MVRANGHLVITDFGLAHVGKTGVPSTNAKSIVGTPHFIAPEVLFSQSHDRMVDYWALVRKLLCLALYFLVAVLLRPVLSAMLCGFRRKRNVTTLLFAYVSPPPNAHRQSPVCECAVS